MNYDIKSDPEYQRHVKEYYSYEHDPSAWVTRNYVVPITLVISVALLIIGLASAFR
jgi:hypothetical protein